MFNKFMHDYVYKRFKPEVGARLRREYDAGLITSREQFLNALDKISGLQEMRLS